MRSSCWYTHCRATSGLKQSSCFMRCLGVMALSTGANPRWMKGRFWVFHVTPGINLESILAEGVNPKFSQCARPVCYWCVPAALLWAIAHTSARHATPVSALTVLKTIFVPQMQRTGIVGLYQTRNIIRIETWNTITYNEVLDAFMPEYDEFGERDYGQSSKEGN